MKLTTTIFDDEQGQAVRIPDGFQFASKEVWIRKDERTGDVILTSRLSWGEIFAGLDAADVPADFLSPEERNQGPSQVREDLLGTDDPPDDTSVE